MTIQSRLAEIRARIAAARAASPRGQDVELLAVSKMHDANAVREAIAAGQHVFAENRVQEAAGKFPALREAYPDMRLHLIGPLQTNKVRDAVRLFDAVHTVDRAVLAEKLANEMVKQNKQLLCFIQVNTGAEAQKAGVAVAELPELLRFCREEAGLEIKGLMCIPPVAEPPEKHFKLLDELADEYQLPLLSMGMSADYETAIRLGATHVRVGSAIFGVR
jgi:pyridoxal phosphate enzyme (YggS family)